MKKIKAASWLVVLVSGLLLISTSPSFGGDNKSGESANSQSSEKSNSNSSELASTYGSKYWGNPSKEISNSKDQEDYDRSQTPIPGIEVAGSEVFSTFKGRQGAAAVIGGTGDLIDHGGQVLNEIHIYPIFWGAPTATFTQGYKDAINNFFISIQCGAGTPTTACTGHSDLVKQYFRTSVLKSTSPVIKYMRSFSDTSAPPSSSPSTASIAAEAAKVVKANNLSLDPLGFYLIFTNNFPSRAGYCAWHSAGSYKATSNSTPSWFTIAYMPFVGTMSGCSASNIPTFTTFKTSQAVHSVINVTTHELYETMTDSLLNNKYAWYDSAGYENGDKCAWNFPSTINGYLVQSEYSNLTHNCPNLTSN